MRSTIEGYEPGERVVAIADRYIDAGRYARSAGVRHNDLIVQRTDDRGGVLMDLVRPLVVLYQCHEGNLTDDMHARLAITDARVVEVW